MEPAGEFVRSGASQQQQEAGKALLVTCSASTQPGSQALLAEPRSITPKHVRKAERGEEFSPTAELRRLGVLPEHSSARLRLQFDDPLDCSRHDNTQGWLCMMQESSLSQMQVDSCGSGPDNTDSPFTPVRSTGQPCAAARLGHVGYSENQDAHSSLVSDNEGQQPPRSPTPTPSIDMSGDSDLEEYSLPVLPGGRNEAAEALLRAAGIHRSSSDESKNVSPVIPDQSEDMEIDGEPGKSDLALSPAATQRGMLDTTRASLSFTYSPVWRASQDDSTWSGISPTTDGNLRVWREEQIESRDVVTMVTKEGAGEEQDAVGSSVTWPPAVCYPQQTDQGREDDTGQTDGRTATGQAAESAARDQLQGHGGHQQPSQQLCSEDPGSSVGAGVQCAPNYNLSSMSSCQHALQCEGRYILSAELSGRRDDSFLSPDVRNVVDDHDDRSGVGDQHELASVSSRPDSMPTGGDWPELSQVGSRPDWGFAKPVFASQARLTLPQLAQLYHEKGPRARLPCTSAQLPLGSQVLQDSRQSKISHNQTSQQPPSGISFSCSPEYPICGQTIEPVAGKQRVPDFSSQQNIHNASDRQMAEGTSYRQSPESPQDLSYTSEQTVVDLSVRQPDNPYSHAAEDLEQQCSAQMLTKSNSVQNQGLHPSLFHRTSNDVKYCAAYVQGMAVADPHTAWLDPHGDSAGIGRGTPGAGYMHAAASILPYAYHGIPVAAPFHVLCQQSVFSRQPLLPWQGDTSSVGEVAYYYGVGYNQGMATGSRPLFLESASSDSVGMISGHYSKQPVTQQYGSAAQSLLKQVATTTVCGSEQVVPDDLADPSYVEDFLHGTAATPDRYLYQPSQTGRSSTNQEAVELVNARKKVADIGGTGSGASPFLPGSVHVDAKDKIAYHQGSQVVVEQSHKKVSSGIRHGAASCTAAVSTQGQGKVGHTAGVCSSAGCHWCYPAWERRKEGGNLYSYRPLPAPQQQHPPAPSVGCQQLASWPAGAHLVSNSGMALEDQQTISSRTGSEQRNMPNEQVQENDPFSIASPHRYEPGTSPAAYPAAATSVSVTRPDIWCPNYTTTNTVRPWYEKECERKESVASAESVPKCSIGYMSGPFVGQSRGTTQQGWQSVGNYESTPTRIRPSMSQWATSLSSVNLQPQMVTDHPAYMYTAGGSSQQQPASVGPYRSTDELGECSGQAPSKRMKHNSAPSRLQEVQNATLKCSLDESYRKTDPYKSDMSPLCSQCDLATFGNLTPDGQLTDMQLDCFQSSSAKNKKVLSDFTKSYTPTFVGSSSQLASSPKVSKSVPKFILPKIEPWQVPPNVCMFPVPKRQTGKNHPRCALPRRRRTKSQSRAMKQRMPPNVCVLPSSTAGDGAVTEETKFLSYSSGVSTSKDAQRHPSIWVCRGDSGGHPQARQAPQPTSGFHSEHSSVKQRGSNSGCFTSQQGSEGSSNINEICKISEPGPRYNSPLQVGSKDNIAYSQPFIGYSEAHGSNPAWVDDQANSWVDTCQWMAGPVESQTVSSIIDNQAGSGSNPVTQAKEKQAGISNAYKDKTIDDAGCDDTVVNCEVIEECWLRPTDTAEQDMPQHSSEYDPGVDASPDSSGLIGTGGKCGQQPDVTVRSVHSSEPKCLPQTSTASTDGSMAHPYVPEQGLDVVSSAASGEDELNQATSQQVPVAAVCAAGGHMVTCLLIASPVHQSPHSSAGMSQQHKMGTALLIPAVPGLHAGQQAGMPSLAYKDTAGLVAFPDCNAENKIESEQSGQGVFAAGSVCSDGPGGSVAGGADCVPAVGEEVTVSSSEGAPHTTSRMPIKLAIKGSRATSYSCGQNVEKSDLFSSVSSEHCTNLDVGQTKSVKRIRCRKLQQAKASKKTMTSVDGTSSMLDPFLSFASGGNIKVRSVDEKKVQAVQEELQPGEAKLSVLPPTAKPTVLPPMKLVTPGGSHRKKAKQRGPRRRLPLVSSLFVDKQLGTQETTHDKNGHLDLTSPLGEHQARQAEELSRVESQGHQFQKLSPRVSARKVNCFMKYAQKHRRSVSSEYPQLNNRQVSKILGQRWRSLSNTEKANYRDSKTAGSPHSTDGDTSSSSENTRVKVKLRRGPLLPKNNGTVAAGGRVSMVQCSCCNRWRQDAAQQTHSRASLWECQQEVQQETE